MTPLPKFAVGSEEQVQVDPQVHLVRVLLPEHRQLEGTLVVSLILAEVVFSIILYINMK